MVASTLAKEEKIEEMIEERKLIVHEIAMDLENAKNIVEKDKTGFFAKLGFLKPKREEIECESILLRALGCLEINLLSGLFIVRSKA